MPARNAHSVCFTEQHDEIIQKISAEMQISLAEAVRIIIDKGLDAAPDVRLSYFLTRRNELERELEDVKAKIVIMEKAVADHPFALFSREDKKKVVVEEKPIPELSGHDEFAHFLTRLGFGGALGRAAERKVGAHLKDHPEWMPEVPAEYQSLFNNGRKEAENVSSSGSGTVPTA